MDEIATKLLQVTIDPNKYEATLTIIGAGGFGKTTTVISLCHYPVVNNHFTDGFVFIELGPQATDPSIKLRDIYNLLTGEQCGINVVEQKINQLTSDYFHNLLVIIDDVWHVEDAEPLVRAFSNCKTILTTRMNDIEQSIPSKQSVIIGPMTQHEAVTLITSGVIDSSRLSQQDISLLDELAQDVHLWPLLLSLVRGQLFHNLKQRHSSYHNSIQNVQAKLHHKGLTAFDKNNIAINRSRKLAVKACIEMTLELLTKPLSDKIKMLILYNGIGTSLQIAVLSNLWSISQQDAEETVDTLWAYGLVQFIDTIISPNNITQHCVEVHAVISQYIIESMDCYEANKLSPVGRSSTSVGEGLALTFRQSFGVDDLLSLSVVDYLKYRLSEIENKLFPVILKTPSTYTVNDSHVVAVILQNIKDNLMRPPQPYPTNLLSSFNNEINSLIGDCKQILIGAHKLCRKINQRVQRIFCEQNYNELIQTFEEFIKNYPLFSVTQKAVTMVERIKPYHDGELLLHDVIYYCEELQMRTCDYHEMSTLMLPLLKLHIEQHKQITDSLFKGSPDIELTYRNFLSGKIREERELVWANLLIKLEEVAPNWVKRQASLT